MESLWFFGLAQQPQNQKAVLFWRSFFLVVEINLGGKFGGHAFSKGETNQNTSEALSAQNLTILFLSPQITGHFCSVPGDWPLQLCGTTLPEGRGGMEQD